MTVGNELSFLPEGFSARKGRRRALVVGLSLVFAVGATIAIAAVRVQRSVNELETRSALVTSAYARAARKIEPETRNREQKRRIIEHAAIAAGLIENVPRSIIVAELTNTLPPGSSLLDVTINAVPHADPPTYSASSFDMRKATADARHQAEQLTAPTAAIINISVHLTGLADSDRQVAQYLSRLTNSPLFKDVNLVISEAYQPSGKKQVNLRRFQIQLSLKNDGALNLPAASDTTATADVTH